ncbi:MAG: cyclase family protein [Acidobacteria bacterium]|nr:cyclase family protein [Acidobacteriota bacterium]
MANWTDISVPLLPGMVQWPGDPPLEVGRYLELDRDGCNATRLSLSAHAGTHIDAPLHYIAAGTPVDALPIGATCGRARVVRVYSLFRIGAAELEGYRIREGERVLLKTANSESAWWLQPLRDDYVHLSPDAARLLAARRVRCVGIDYLSVGAPGEDGAEAHRILLEAGVAIIEGLNLAAPTPGEYEMFCLPVRVEGADGAPARAVLRHLEGA